MEDFDNTYGALESYCSYCNNNPCICDGINDAVDELALERYEESLHLDNDENEEV